MGQQNPAPVENGGKHPIIYRLSTIPGAFRNHPQLVGGLEPWFFFPIQLGITMDFFPHSVGNIFIPIPTDFHSMIFQRGRRKTTKSSIEPSIFDMIPPEDGTVNHYFSRMILLFYSFGVYYIYMYRIVYYMYIRIYMYMYIYICRGMDECSCSIFMYELLSIGMYI